jgi:hypothetical protein
MSEDMLNLSIKELKNIKNKKKFIQADYTKNIFKSEINELTK